LGVDERSLIPVICGPTAAGKSTLAAALAARFPVTILVADSRQIYRGFDIGTAKPTRSELAAIPHRGVDIVHPTDRFSAAAWADAAEQWIEESHAAGRIPLIVGGTGFYLRALFSPLFEESRLDEGRRQELQRQLETMTLAELQRWVATLDPARSHLGRAQLLRAIEVALLSGQRLSTLHRERARSATRMARYLVVDPGTVLPERIAARTEAMFAGGWVEEVKMLDGKTPDDAPAWKATGYRVVRDLVHGHRGEKEAREAIVIQTRQYAKRQRTWIRHQLDADLVTHVDPTSASAAGIAERWLRDLVARPIAGRSS
jgi:tRNA dimethylallyltransferase